MKSKNYLLVLCSLFLIGQAKATNWQQLFSKVEKEEFNEIITLLENTEDENKTELEKPCERPLISVALQKNAPVKLIKRIADYTCVANIQTAFKDLLSQEKYSRKELEEIASYFVMDRGGNLPVFIGNFPLFDYVAYCTCNINAVIWLGDLRYRPSKQAINSLKTALNNHTNNSAQYIELAPSKSPEKEEYLEQFHKRTEYLKKVVYVIGLMETNK